MMKLLCVCLLLFIQTHYTSALVEGRLNVVTKTKYAQTKYYTGCGWWGKRCTRYSTRSYKEHTCKPGYRSTNNVDCPYAICDGDINPTGACNIDYPSSHIIYSNGNTQFSSGGTCSTPENCVGCNEGFYSSPERCRMCSAISNCDLETCTSSTNQQCARCEGVSAESPGKRAYKVSTDRRACGKACSWRSDSTRCYPGTCPTELASSCQCMEEFSGHHCQTIDTYPSIVFNTLKLLGSGLKVKEAPENPNEGSPQDVSWTNINDSRRIQYKFTSKFIPTSELPDAPAYIADYAVGIIYGVVNFKLFRDGEDIKNQSRQCSGVIPSSPNQAVFTCQDDFPAGEVLDLPVNSGDILEFSFESKNGGFVEVLNFERASAKETFFFDGKTRVNTFRLGIDFIRPHHCSVDINSTCTDNMLTVPIATTMSPVPVKWGGWLDDVGVYVYSLSLYDLVDRNKTDENSKLADHSVVDTKNIFQPEVEHDLVVTSPGAYGLVLSAYDKAGNYKSARRIFIYDGTSQVETVHNSVLLVKSAAQQTQYTWQWTTGPVLIDWNLRYMNKLHVSNNWLKGVKAVADVPDEYDDNGISRGIEPIPNIQAIVEYQTSFLVDHTGGSSITSTPPDSQFSTQMLSQQQTISPDLMDGDTLRFWIRAYDIRREFLEENVTVHIDTSPPVIEDLWLTRGDRLNVSVHSVEEFNKMTFEWVSFDIHSGLETVSWRLFDNFTGQDILHGIEHLSHQGDTQSLDECNRKYGTYPRGSNCYCTPGVGCYHRHYQVTPNIIDSNLTFGGVFHHMQNGVHDSDYFLEVTVMNQAKLSTKRDLKITIDASPPHPGHVHEGIPGLPEVDFQSDLEISAYWDGFFDKESGVKFYQYGFADHCLSEDRFGLDLGLLNVTETYSTHASWKAPAPGKYFITVVAFNRALEPSRTVCSDGVTIDETLPFVTEVAIGNSRVVPGLVTSSTGDVWLIDSERRRSSVRDPDDACRLRGTSIEESVLTDFPLHLFDNGTLVSYEPAVCLIEQPFPTVFFKTVYIANEIQLYLNWTGTDSESGIFDYELGLMTDSSGQAAPDILPFISTDHHPHYQGFHPGLTEGQEFYVALKAVNKAGLSSTKVVGPVIVHSVAPVFNGRITVRLNSDLDYLIAEWEKSAFVDPEPVYLQHEVAVGTESMATTERPYTKLKTGGSCVLTLPPTCAIVSLKDLHWDLHHSHTYFVSVRVNNLVGLSVVAVSDPYVHDIRLPSAGVVMDLCPEGEQSKFDMNDLVESDYQISTSSFKTRWYGFNDGTLHVTYTAGLGTSPGHVDIRHFEDTGDTLEHEFTNLLLNTSQTYFVTVVARSGGGQIVASSDGVTVIKEHAQIDVVVYDGSDCLGKGVLSWAPNHQNETFQTTHEVCKEDMDYQKSTSMFVAHWNLEEADRRQFPDVYWRLEKKLPQSENFWHPETEYEYSADNSRLFVTGVSLDPGFTYRTAVKFCAVGVCALPVYSNGVTVLHHPPASGSMSLAYKEMESGSEINVIMSRFHDPDVPVMDEAYEAIDRYEWALTDNSHDRKLLTQWMPVDKESVDIEGKQMKLKIVFPDQLDFSKCRRLAVKGYNKVNQYTTISTDIRNCSAYDPLVIVPSIVIDAVGYGKVKNKEYPVFLEQNGEWKLADADYTPHQNMLSAVWPTLRHRNYTWAVISGDHVDPPFHYKRESIMTLANPCALPDVIQCGTTDEEYINVVMTTPLPHGSRYYMCVHARPTRVEYEKWTGELPEVKACSDGITVDVTPPRGGRVFIGDLHGKKYQTSKSEIDVYWDSFADVEEGGMAAHPSSITHYKVALGTVPGGRDVMTDEIVGLMNHVTFHALNLHDGNTIYATVEAIDFVNKTTAVVSDGLLIDSTPPQTTGQQISGLGDYITNTKFEACWDNVFVDAESGMSQFEVSAGSRPGRDDLLQFITVTSSCHLFDVSGIAQDGHVLYVAVKGYNKAGRHTLFSSRALVVDTTAPRQGFVYDGKETAGETDLKDKDFVTNVTELGAYWVGFSDPHSFISHFLIRVGSCPGCEDTLHEQNIGGRQDISFKSITFTQGVKYYVEVSACNMAGLCSKSTSDGVILDTMPPVIGKVADGTKDEDIQFQASRSFLGCKWRGFFDPESGLHHYEWRVGTSPGGDDVLSSRNSALEEVDFHNLPHDQQLPVGKRLYTTVRAYNKAGVYSESISNGFIIDHTPPTVVRPPTKKNKLESLNKAFTRTAMSFEWEFSDNESSVEHHYLSISSHQLGEFNPSVLKVPGFLREYIFTDLDLHDGSLYKLKVTACNMAGLCTSASSTDILVDSSPPTTGAFAVATDHAAGLTRHQADWMTWTSSSLRLAWLGFSDLHSDIDHYIVTVGTTPFNTDLNKNGQYVKVSLTGQDQQDEGIVQLFEIDTVDISTLRTVFVALWAANGVGLKSTALHSELELVSGGGLELVRRCQPYNCEGHCVCAVEDGACSSLSSCNILDQDKVIVTDVTGLHLSLTSDEDYSCFNNYLSATWSGVNENIAEYYEISAGESDADSPEGVFDTARDRVWFEVGHNKSASLPLQRGNELSSGHTYSFFVRSWYNVSSYSISKSDGVMIETDPLHVTVSVGTLVMELMDPNSRKDTDFQVDANSIIISWRNKFLGHNALLRYKVFISTTPGGHSIHESGDLTDTMYTATGLSLETNTVYYSSVLAYNKAGLVSWAFSDGVQVDTDPPLPGVVHDGEGMHDIDYQPSSTQVSASWYGFYDSDSAIVKYFWCVGTTNDPEDCSVLDWQDSGLHTVASSEVQPIEPGTTVWNKVYAVDNVGHRSPVVISNGVTIDTTPPDIQGLAYLGENLLHNPSFEEASASGQSLANWQVNEESSINIIKSPNSLARHGESYAEISGSVHQTISNLIPGHLYRVVLHTGYTPIVESEHRTSHGFVEVDKEHFTIYHDPNMCKGICDAGIQNFILWNTHTFSFISTNETTRLTIGTPSRTMTMVLDHVSLQTVEYVGSEEKRTENHLVISTVFLKHWSSIHVSWHFKDEQSPITQYTWAVGLVQGGTQLQDFKNVGVSTQGTLSSLQLVHGSSIHVTVTATNAAGLTSVSYSDPVTVDMTPPVILQLNDGLSDDVDYLTPSEMSANWIVQDEDSDVSYCDWCIGRSEGSHDIRGFERVPSGQSFIKYDLSEVVTSSMLKVFTTLRCYNRAGLAATATSDGADIVVENGTVSVSEFEIMEERSSIYWERGICHTDLNKLRIKWGVVSEYLKSLKVNLQGGGSIFQHGVSVEFPYSSCTLVEVGLITGEIYNATLMPLGYSNQFEQFESLPFRVYDHPPSRDAKVPITTIRDGGETTLSWANLFISPSKKLIYEVEIGQVEGGADVTDSFFTEETSMKLRLTPLQRHITDVFVSVTAIDPCGLTSHYSQRVSIASP